MKIKWNYIKGILLFGLLAFLFSFAKNRNKTRNVDEFSINFTEGDNVYLTKAAVNKLLIQKVGGAKNLSKDTLDLSELERELNKQDMIAHADAYVTVDGVLGVTITQRKPIARVFSGKTFYIDSEGEPMPLSPFHSARVPILAGVDETHVPEVFPLLEEIENSPFLKRHVVAIKRLPKGNYELEMRGLKFYVLYGNMENLKKKTNNFLAFYKKAKKENLLNTYKKVDLRFSNQVVATKI